MEDKNVQLEELCQALLPRLISPFVHRVNNSLAVISGAVEFFQADSSEVEVRREVDRMRQILQSLVRFSGAHPSREESFDLCEVARAIRRLVEPLALSLGIELEIVTPRSPTVMRSSSVRVEQLLVAFSIREILAAHARHASSGDPSAARVRVAIGRARARMTFSITRGVSDGEDVSASRLFSCATAFADELHMRVTARVVGRAGTVRFGFVPVHDDPAHTHDAEGGGDAGQARAATRLVLFEDDDSMRDLMAEVLVEAGYDVDARDDQPTAADLRATNTDLLILNARAGALHPELLADESLSDRFLLVGESIGANDLLEAVKERLPATVRSAR